jgi:hypothetical protein
MSGESIYISKEVLYSSRTKFLKKVSRTSNVLNFAAFKGNLKIP